MCIVQVTGRKPTEEPNFIFKLQSDILSKINKMSSTGSNSSERNLSTVKKPSAQTPGLVILDFSNEKDVYREQERSQVVRTKTLRENSKGNKCNRASSFKNKRLGDDSHFAYGGKTEVSNSNDDTVSTKHLGSTIRNHSQSPKYAIRKTSKTFSQEIEIIPLNAVQEKWMEKSAKYGYEKQFSQSDAKEIMKQSHTQLASYTQEKQHLIHYKPFASEKPWGKPRLELNPATLHDVHRNVKSQQSKTHLYVSRNQEKASSYTSVPHLGSLQKASSSFKGTSLLSKSPSSMATFSGGCSIKSPELGDLRCVSARTTKKGLKKPAAKDDDDDIIILD